MAKRFSMAIVMALLVAAMSISMASAGSNGAGNQPTPDGVPTWSG
ncbi:MAG: hypothetical protein WBO46_13470 [Caldilineaceae bacterium]